ncbi:unnamed protein product [Schistosoma curassoni]|uniref:Ovule protein n=1 Tax=Schistosoma curassoni TaxID=6186 RepID=A0A183K6G4_9TREM|nr:unnamed protein product [Schistosoma curassoni]
MHPDGFDPVSPSLTIRDVTTELSGPRPTSCRTEMYLQLIYQCQVRFYMFFLTNYLQTLSIISPHKSKLRK